MARSPVVAPAPPSESPRHIVYRPRKSGAKRLLVGLNIFVAVCLLGAAGVYGYVKWRFGQINRVSIADLVGGSGSSQPMTILVVGSDSRAGIKSGQDLKTFGSQAVTAGQRSDTIMLVHLDPATRSASLLSIPRDLFVQIPGTTRRDRINTTFDTGPDLLVRAIHDDLGIEINHYVEVDFNSFRGVVNAVGAVHVYFPTPARDTFSGLNITTPGCYGLNGEMALEYVRARHYQYYQNGSWHSEGLSDLARIKRQQDFVRKVAKKAVASGLTSPLKLNGVIGSLTTNLTVDSAFHQSEMLNLARRYRSFNPDLLQTATLPTNPAVIGGADVLLLDQAAAQQAIDAFLGTAPPSAGPGIPAVPTNVSPGEVTVKVLNGSGRSGQAASVSSALRQSGFVVTGTGNADSARYIQSVIRYAPNQETQARFLQSLVIGGAQLLPDSTLVGTHLALITGSSYSGLHPAAGAAAQTLPGSTPTTSGAPATTTTVSPLPGASANAVPPVCAA
jgi:LCP family protein required for cell wall assembly